MSNAAEKIEKDRDEPWIETYTGLKFFLHDKEDTYQINVKDIGHALALNCRYNGHCSQFYSVAEHSVLISLLVPPELALEGLLHDATEAYLSDICRPFKGHMANYHQLEDDVYQRIAKKYFLPKTISPIVKHYDVAICGLEARKLMRSKGEGWNEDVGGLTIETFREKTGYEDIPCWSWEEAKFRFYSRFEELTRL